MQIIKKNYTPLTQSLIKNKNGNDTCLICYEEFSETKLFKEKNYELFIENFIIDTQCIECNKKKKCSLYHVNCIKKWIQKSEQNTIECPICHNPLNYHEIFYCYEQLIIIQKYINDSIKKINAEKSNDLIKHKKIKATLNNFIQEKIGKDEIKAITNDIISESESVPQLKINDDFYITIKYIINELYKINNHERTKIKNRTAQIFLVLLESLKEFENQSSKIIISNVEVSRNKLKKTIIKSILFKKNLLTNNANLTIDLLLSQSTIEKTIKFEKNIIEYFQ